ncbi:MAG: FAD binding domain-containing protein [Acidobacteria bacterium]|nr:FAD binding domain-containing protein [Acidobacteriota bacterium]
MKAFEYVDPTNLTQALGALSPSRGRALAIAGGQDLLALMKDYVLQPDRLVNVKRLDQTVAEADGGGWRVGAAVRLADLARHEGLRSAYPALAHAADEVGTPQIRNIGTVGGNLCQRPRCWYFRNEEFRCLKKGGPRCYAVDGENQFHAIFGDGPCHIVHPSSLAVPLLAYGAIVETAGPSGPREWPAADFFQMPDRNLFGETVLGPNELITAVRLPALKNVRSGHYEVRYKQSTDWPMAFATVALTMDGSRVASARVVLGAVAPVPWPSPAAEAVLGGQVVDEAIASRAADAAVRDAQPMSGNAYKVQVARTAVKRAVLRAAGLLA